jgi:hypothetical protein
MDQVCEKLQEYPEDMYEHFSEVFSIAADGIAGWIR